MQKRRLRDMERDKRQDQGGVSLGDKWSYHENKVYILITQCQKFPQPETELDYFWVMLQLYFREFFCSYFNLIHFDFWSYLDLFSSFMTFSDFGSKFILVRQHHFFFLVIHSFCTHQNIDVFGYFPSLFNVNSNFLSAHFFFWRMLKGSCKVSALTLKRSKDHLRGK